MLYYVRIYTLGGGIHGGYLCELRRKYAADDPGDYGGGGHRGRLSPTAKVCIKPNLVVSRLADTGSTTHPEIVESILQYLQAHSIKHIVIAEDS